MLLYSPCKFQKSRVLNCKLNNEGFLLNIIREWVIQQNPSITTSTHWWFKDLPQNINDIFLHISKNKKIAEMFIKSFGSNYAIDILHDMNEIYVSPPSNNNKGFQKNASDNIFYTRHIDGPFYYIPFASCYRVIVGLDDNRDIMTIFNIIPENYIIKTGDVVGFDFHRECHYITPIIRSDSNTNTNTNSETTISRTDKYRVILKIHYCVYPRWAMVFGFILGKLSIMYNKLFRDLFLFTIKPQSKFTKCLANIMVFSTKVYHDIEYYIGNNNIQYISLLYYVSLNTHYNVFLFGSSFIHYLRWIDTADYYQPANYLFIRDYNFYKFLYMLQFIHMYISHKMYVYVDIDVDGRDYNSDCPMLYTAYTAIATSLLSTLYLYDYTMYIPKLLEIFLTFVMLVDNTINLSYMEYLYIYVNITFNYIQLFKPLDC